MMHARLAKIIGTLARPVGEWRCLFRGSLHGFDPEQFHDRCDHEGPTLTVALVTDGPIIGGFTTRPFFTPDEELEEFVFLEDAGAFVFRMASDTPSVTVYRQREDLIAFGSAIRHSYESGPGWGHGDLYLLELAGRRFNNCLGSIYSFEKHKLCEMPGVEYGVDGQFSIDEIEVFLV